MPRLINIAKSQGSPVYVDPSDITAVMTSPEKNEVTLFNSKGQLLHMSCAHWDVDFQDVVDKIAQAGKQLFGFTARWPEGQDSFRDYTYYIAPEAVNFITTSKPSVQGVQGVIIGVKGYGRVESYGTTPQELDELLATMRAAKPMKEFTPDIAMARWSNPDRLCIDFNAVTRIVDDKHMGIDVSFDEFDRRLDVHTPMLDINDLVTQEEAEAAQAGGQESLSRLFWVEGTRRQKELERQARQKLAEEIAAANGTLTHVPVPGQSVYLRPEESGFVYSFESDEEFILLVGTQKTARNPYPDDLKIYFKTKEDRQRAFDVLNSANDERPGKATPKPSPAR